MEKKDFNRIPIFGIVLVVLGVGLLLRQLHIIRIEGGTFLLFGLLIYGMATVIRSFVMNVRNQIFFGSLCFFSGILLLLGKYDVVESSPFVYVPGFLIVFGLAFTTLFIFNIKDFHLLVPAAVFILIGTAFMMTEVGFWYVSDVREAIGMYWPAALIIFGGLMLLRRKEKIK
ncbi:MAG: hypothetical protein PHP42_05130 [Bacteroidota bacterium]|nr:hypothetical protein [Bacteroidota bacterium]